MSRNDTFQIPVNVLGKKRKWPTPELQSLDGRQYIRWQLNAKSKYSYIIFQGFCPRNELVAWASGRKGKRVLSLVLSVAILCININVFVILCGEFVFKIGSI